MSDEEVSKGWEGKMCNRRVEIPWATDPWGNMTPEGIRGPGVEAGIERDPGPDSRKSDECPRGSSDEHNDRREVRST